MNRNFIERKLYTVAIINLNVNGKKQTVDVDPKTPMLWVLREHLNLVGTKYGCGIAQCGACTVHLDGTAVRSCQLPASAAENKAITTIEALSENGDHPLQQAWLEHDVQHDLNSINEAASQITITGARYSEASERMLGR